MAAPAVRICDDRAETRAAGAAMLRGRGILSLHDVSCSHHARLKRQRGHLNGTLLGLAASASRLSSKAAA